MHRNFARVHPRHFEKSDLGNKNEIWNRSDQSGPLSGRTTLANAEKPAFSGSFPIRNTLPNPPPIGTVHLLPLPASQLAVIIGADVRYHPSGRL